MAECLSPMTGGQQPRVIPGPVRGGACPPPTEIVVVETRKVFDFCFQEDMLERCFFVTGLGTGATVQDCNITSVTCQEIQPREPVPNDDGLALTSLQITLELTIRILPTATATTPVTVRRNIAFPKRVVLCAPVGTDVTCDVQGTCICSVQPPSPGAVPGTAEPNVCCTIQLCTVVTSAATVKLLLPSFGTVVPQRCNVAAAFGGCPPMPPELCGPGPATTA